MKKESSYQPALDVMNIVACIAVIAMHVNGAVWSFSYERYWLTSLIIECVCFWAVPVFFMISGATLLDYRTRYTTREYFQKRFGRTGVPFLFWSVVSIFWAVFVTHGLEPDVLNRVPLFLDAVLNTRGLSIYWFFPPLFALYLAIPFLSLIPQENREAACRYGIAASFVTTACLPLLCSLAGIAYNGSLNMPVNGGGMVIFLLIGYYVTHYPLSKQIRCRVIYPLGVFGLLLRYFGTLIRSYSLGGVDGMFSGCDRFPCVVLAVAVFVWFWYHDWSFFTENQKAQKLLRTVSGASFGVYLTHFYIMRFLLDTFGFNMRSWEWRILGTAAVYLLAITATLLLKKIPGLRRLVP